MRPVFFAVLLALGLSPAVSGQTRFEAGPVARLDEVFVEGDGRGSTAVAGVVGTITFGRRFGAEAEVTQAANRIERSYRGWFISYAQGPNASRDEIERLAPTALRTLGYEPGLGWSAAFLVRGELNRRCGIVARIGASARQYVETSGFTMLTIPAGVDPARVARDFQGLSYSDHRTRGGLLLGVGVPLALGARLGLEPEVRFVYGGPARIGEKHRELGVGVRGLWKF